MDDLDISIEDLAGVLQERFDNLNSRLAALEGKVMTKGAAMVAASMPPGEWERATSSDGLKPQVRDYDETHSVADTMREHFGFVDVDPPPEITPAMIEAGWEAAYDVLKGQCVAYAALEAIYKAMEAKRK